MNKGKEPFGISLPERIRAEDVTGCLVTSPALLQICAIIFPILSAG